MAVVEGKAKVTLDGAEAGQQLMKLERQSLELKRALIDLKSSEVLDKKKIKETEESLKLVGKEMQVIKIAAKDYASTLNNLSGASLREMEQAAKKLSYELKNMARNTEEYKQKAGDLSRVKYEIAKVRQEMSAAGVQTQTFGDRLRNIGSNMLAATGIIGGFTALATVVRNAFNSIKEFEKKLSELEAITGATGADLDFLKNKAKDLAATYGDSASNIVEAMKMVGSAKPELLSNVDALSKVTEAVLTLSKASGMDLATATSSLTTIMNQFGHDATKANEDINILAAGSKFGAVEVDYLADAISKVGTIANSAGLSLEQTTAAMELFGEKGIKAEIAGTGFKSVLVKLQEDTKNYTNGVFDLNKAIDNNQNIAGNNIELQKKFGKEFFNLAQILLQNRDRFNQLTTQVTGTQTAFEQAAIAMDNLSGDLDKMKGAWDKMILSIEDGDGVISKAIRGVVQEFTDFIGSIGKANDAQASSTDKMRAWIDVLSRANPFLNMLVKKVKEAENGFLSLIPGMDRAIKGFKEFFGIQEKAQQIPGIFDADKLREQARLLQEQILQAKNNTEEVTKMQRELTEDEKKELEKRRKEAEAHYKKILDANANLIDQINQLGLELIDNDRLRAETELEIWYNKEREKIETSIAAAQTKNSALEVLEEVHQKRMQEINEKAYQEMVKQQEADAENLKAPNKSQLSTAPSKLLSSAGSAAGAGAGSGGSTPEQSTLEDYTTATYAVLDAASTAINGLKDQEVIKAEETAAKQIEILRKQKADELKILNENFKKGLISEEEFKKQEEKINEDYNTREAQASADLEAQKKEIMKRYADMEFAVKASNIIVNTAEAIMRALAQLGPVAGPIAAVAIGATGAIQLGLANAERQRIKGLAGGGKFGVQRKQDGRYFNASYGGNGYGYYSEPTVLVAEEGEEFVVSNRALKVPHFKRAVDAIDAFQRGNANLQLNYEGLNNRIKGFADGGFIAPANTTQQIDQTQNFDELILEFRSFRDEITTWATSIEVFVEIQRIRDAETQLSSIEADVTI